MKRIAFRHLITVLALALLFAGNIDAKKKKTTSGVPAGLTGEARECYMKASKGDEGAQLLLAYFYQKGENAPRDLNKAIQWYKKAAEKGNVIAQYNLGDIYDSKKDFTTAASWYEMAANQGDAASQLSLGNCYFNGEGKPQDDGKAIYWFTKASQQGLAAAQRCMGICYDEGRGVQQDREKAVEWYRKAANQGDAAAHSTAQPGTVLLQWRGR